MDRSTGQRHFRSVETVVVVAATVIAFLSTGCVKRQPPVRRPPAVDSYVRGVMAQRSGDTDGAIASLEAATKQNPKLTMARSMLGDLYKDKGEYDKAAQQYEAVTKLDPYTGRNFYKLGVAQQLLVRLQDAIASYLTAIKLDPRDWESNMNLGLVYLALGRNDQALGYLSRATMLNPGAAPAFGNLGVALDATKRYSEAEIQYRRAIELDPEDGPILSNLGSNLMAQKKPEQAVTVLRRLVAVADSPAARKRFGDALLLAKRPAEAIPQYETALRQNPRYYPALNGLGAALIAKYEQGLALDDATRDAAVGAWRKSLALNAEQPRINELIKKWADESAPATP